MGYLTKCRCSFRRRKPNEVIETCGGFVFRRVYLRFHSGESSFRSKLVLYLRLKDLTSLGVSRIGPRAPESSVGVYLRSSGT